MRLLKVFIACIFSFLCLSSCKTRIDKNLKISSKQEKKIEFEAIDSLKKLISVLDLSQNKLSTKAQNTIAFLTQSEFFQYRWVAEVPFSEENESLCLNGPTKKMIAKDTLTCEFFLIHLTEIANKNHTFKVSVLDAGTSYLGEDSKLTQNLRNEWVKNLGTLSFERQFKALKSFDSKNWSNFSEEFILRAFKPVKNYLQRFEMVNPKFDVGLIPNIASSKILSKFDKTNVEVAANLTILQVLQLAQTQQLESISFGLEDISWLEPAVSGSN